MHIRKKCLRKFTLECRSNFPGFKRICKTNSFITNSILVMGRLSRIRKDDVILIIVLCDDDAYVNLFSFVQKFGDC